jgi:hypothetical protein
MSEILVLADTVRSAGWGVLIVLACVATGLLLFDRNAKAPAAEEETWPMRRAA